MSRNPLLWYLKVHSDSVCEGHFLRVAQDTSLILNSWLTRLSSQYFSLPSTERLDMGNSNALATELWSLGERCLALEKILRSDVCGLRWVAAGANPRWGYVNTADDFIAVM